MIVLIIDNEDDDDDEGKVMTMFMSVETRSRSWTVTPRPVAGQGSVRIGVTRSAGGLTLRGVAGDLVRMSCGYWHQVLRVFTIPGLTGVASTSGVPVSAKPRVLRPRTCGGERV